MNSQKIKTLKKEIEKFKKLAYHDELTELYNRRGFKEESGKFLKEAIVSKKYKDKRKSIFIDNFSLIVFDIDNFKKLNDAYGHDAGDAAIKFLARTVKEKVRAIDTVARWGGEEFVLGLVGASEEDGFNVADDIRERISKAKIKWRGKYIHFTVSGGVSDLRKFKTLEELFNAADKALYKAKRSGKNRIMKFGDL